jgi:hypothetical protein
VTTRHTLVSSLRSAWVAGVGATAAAAAAAGSVPSRCIATWTPPWMRP